MSIFARLDRNPPRRTLIAFGVTMFAMLALVGCGLRFGAHRPVAATIVWCVGALVLAASPIRAVARPMYIGWMGLGLILRMVTSPVLLLAVYVLVFTPVALIFRLIGRDPLCRRKQADAATYWEPRDAGDDAASYLRQY